MGVQTRIVLYATDPASAEAAAARAFSRIGELDATLSDYRKESELSRLPRTPGVFLPVSPDLMRILADARTVSDVTGGAFDVTVGPASKLWRETRRTGRLPDPATLADVRSRVDAHAITLDPTARTARIDRPGIELDAGGIAKCDAAQQARDVLARLGFRRTLVALAGDISIGAPPPGKDAWLVAIGGEGTDRRVLRVRDTCVSTSGDTEQFIEIEGRRYAHIVDPRTALGTPGGVRATVVHSRGAYADALATALCVMGPAAESTAPRLAHAFGAGVVLELAAGSEARLTVVDPHHLLRFETGPQPARATPGGPAQRGPVRE
jgi:thiamine biosynthesis lipoprotein